MSEQDDVTIAEAAAQLGLSDDHPARAFADLADTSEMPVTRELSVSEAQQVRDAWEAEHQRQLAAMREREIAAAGDPANLDEHGRPHFARLRQTAIDPPAWAEECGSCQTVWPCEFASQEAPAGDEPTEK